MNFIRATDDYCSLDNPVPAPILRRGFELDFTPESAVLRIAVSGFYELYINGKRITRGQLAPYINNPDHIIYYDEYDLSDMLNKGKNAIAVILGNGFANQDVQGWNFSKAPFRAPLCLAVELSAGANDKVYTLVSDESFKVHSSAIRFDMYRYGVVYDAREEISGFSEADFDDSDWEYARLATPPRGVITPSRALPIKVRERIKPLSIEKQSNFYYLYNNDATPIKETYVTEGYLYDFGVNCAGVCRLCIKGKRGQRVVIRHCEALRDGKFNMNSIITVTPDVEKIITRYQADEYILSGDGVECFIPVFTYHGFRYAFVEGITEEQATTELLTYEVLNTDITRRAEFTCSDEVINKLYEMGIRSDLSNFHHFPTDCPHREKNGWTGDVSVSAHQYLLNFDCAEAFAVWLENVRCAQRDDGMLPGIVPTDTWGYKWGNGPAWDSVIVNLPYYCYKYDGRVDIIEDNADMIYRYLKYISGRRDERGLVACGLGDWTQPRNGVENVFDSPLEFTDSIQVYEMAEKSAFLFEIIGREEERIFAARLADEILLSIRTHLVSEDGCIAAGECQTSQALALRFGIISEANKREAYRNLIRFIKEKDEHIYTGMIGARHIFHVLFENGDADLALKMITRPDAPSYGNMIELGGTALFEAFIQNGLQESQNHHFLGDILHLFVSKLAGIRVNPTMRDKSEVLVEPIIPSAVSSATASYTFSGGRLVASWMKEDGGVRLNISVPKGVHGIAVLYGKRVPLSEGNFSIFSE